MVLKQNEFNITVVAPVGLWSQTLLDLLALFSFGECEPLFEDMSYEKIWFIEIGGWRLASVPLINMK